MAFESPRIPGCAHADRAHIHLEADSHLRSSEAEFVRRSFHPKSRGEIAEIKEALFKFYFSQRVRRTGSRGIGDGGHSRALRVGRSPPAAAPLLPLAEHLPRRRDAHSPVERHDGARGIS